MITTKIYETEINTSCHSCTINAAGRKVITYDEGDLAILCPDCLKFLLKFLEEIGLKIFET